MVGQTIVRELFQGQSPIGRELRLQSAPLAAAFIAILVVVLSAALMRGAAVLRGWLLVTTAALLEGDEQDLTGARLDFLNAVAEQNKAQYSLERARGALAPPRHRACR